MSYTWSSSQSLLREKLREMRMRSGFTQVQLAQHLGKPQSYVSKVETGERRLDFLETRDYCLACKQDFISFVKTMETFLIQNK
ncbi:MAG: helix-turn-helix domain-containing protein [Betaproteobacteria bacterium]|nr:helix-turn-helix domain-containing protein [Betaproteobacteria bacterium]